VCVGGRGSPAQDHSVQSDAEVKVCGHFLLCYVELLASNLLPASSLFEGHAFCSAFDLLILLEGYTRIHNLRVACVRVCAVYHSLPRKGCIETSLFVLNFLPLLCQSTCSKATDIRAT